MREPGARKLGEIVEIIGKLCLNSQGMGSFLGSSRFTGPEPEKCAGMHTWSSPRKRHLQGSVSVRVQLNSLSVWDTHSPLSNPGACKRCVNFMRDARVCTRWRSVTCRSAIADACMMIKSEGGHYVYRKLRTWSIWLFPLGLRRRRWVEARRDAHLIISEEATPAQGST